MSSYPWVCEDCQYDNPSNPFCSYKRNGTVYREQQLEVSVTRLGVCKWRDRYDLKTFILEDGVFKRSPRELQATPLLNLVEED